MPERDKLSAEQAIKELTADLSAERKVRKEVIGSDYDDATRSNLIEILEEYRDLRQAIAKDA